MKKSLFKDQKQKKLFLFILIASIAGISLLLGFIFVGVKANEYSDQVNRAKEYLQIQSVKGLIQDHNWVTTGYDWGDLEKWQSIIGDVSGQEAVNDKIDEIITVRKLIKEIDVPMFAYGIFLIIIGIISSIGTGLYGNSIFY